ncbi:MAG: hypothetical protein J3K34DRAFT_404550 [Monoraphidium minutum]|nr:MAG: hypothetical protein J3K34DRAFT_404550 [Monoraphidium minutum]
MFTSHRHRTNNTALGDTGQAVRAPCETMHGGSPSRHVLLGAWGQALISPGEGGWGLGLPSCIKEARQGVPNASCGEHTLWGWGWVARVGKGGTRPGHAQLGRQCWVGGESGCGEQEGRPPRRGRPWGRRLVGSSVYEGRHAGGGGVRSGRCEGGGWGRRMGKCCKAQRQAVIKGVRGRQ